jgi:hypothetical protein
MDLKFDVNKMELVVENGDFVLESNLSSQRGGLFLYTKNANLYFPLLGVGISGLINSDRSTQISYLNRWQSQILEDGAKTASFSIDDNMVIQTQCSYE